jgi:hypothetical protein
MTMHLNRFPVIKVLGLLFLISSCGKPPQRQVQLSFNIPPPQSQINRAETENPYKTIAPIHVYIVVTDENGKEVFKQLVVGGDSTYPSPIKTTTKNTAGTDVELTNYPIVLKSFEVPMSTTKLKITGYYVGKGLKENETVCSNTFSSTSSIDQFYVYNFESLGNVTLTNQATTSITITPTAQLVNYDRFAFKVTNADNTPLTANYTEIPSYYDAQGNLNTIFYPNTANTQPTLSSFFLYDSINNTAVKEPCSGLAYSGRVDKYANIATNIPLKLNDKYHFNIAIDQFSINSSDCSKTSDNTGYICNSKQIQELHDKAKPTNIKVFDIVEAANILEAAKTSTVNSCTSKNYSNGTPRTDSLVNETNKIPIFWSLNFATGQATVLNSNTDNFLDAAQTRGVLTPICTRIESNLNPRFADIPTYPTNIQAYLQPTNPYTSAAYRNITASSIRYVANSTDLTLVNSNITKYFGNTQNSNSRLQNNGINLSQNQSLKIMCALFSSEDSTATNFTPNIGTIVPNQFTFSPVTGDYAGQLFSIKTETWADCTSVGLNYGANGLYKYMNTNYFDVNSRDLYINYYIVDEEGYLIYNANYNSTTFKTGADPQTISKYQPSSIKPLSIIFRLRP